MDRDGDGEIKLEEFIVWLLDSSKPVSLGRPAPRSKPATPAAHEDEQAKLAMLQGTQETSAQEVAQLAALSGATAKEAEDIDIPDDDEPEPEPEPEPDAATEASKLAALNALDDGGGLAAPTKARARQGGKAPPTRSRRTQSKDSEAAKLAALENL